MLVHLNWIFMLKRWAEEMNKAIYEEQYIEVRLWIRD